MNHEENNHNNNVENNPRILSRIDKSRNEEFQKRLKKQKKE